MVVANRTANSLSVLPSRDGISIVTSSSLHPHSPTQQFRLLFLLLKKRKKNKKDKVKEETEEEEEEAEREEEEKGKFLVKTRRKL